MLPATDNRRGAGQGPLLLLLAFTGGLTSLGLEIAASRLLAPFFGTSTPIWGALIGLILLYLSVGYFAGGWVADRWPRADSLYLLTALASALVLLIPVLSRPILLFSRSALEQLQAGAVVGALIGVILIFAPSVILLGMVSPYVIRLRVSTVSTAGRAAGMVYAISTAGSILGAFLPAFWWIPSYGTRATLYGLGLVMLAVSVLGLGALRYRRTAAVLLMGLVPLAGLALPLGPTRPAAAADGKVIYESDSEYGYIQVLERGTERDLLLNEGLAIHSIYDPNRLITAGPWDFFSLAPLLGHRKWEGQKPGRVLIIGLAGGTVARILTAIYGPIPIDGVEIDPRIIDVGRSYFAMNEANLNPVAADGRFFLEGTSERYDLIAVDAYRQPYIPFHLTTSEFFQECRRHLTSDGVLAVNAGRGPTGDRRLVNAVSGTLSAVYPEVYEQDMTASLNTIVFATNQPTQPADVATNISRERGAYPALLAEVLAEARDGGNPRLVEPHLPVYTDDLAPVERLIDSIVFRYIASGR